jgi:hypothetical protein
LFGELTQATQQILGIAAEREPSEAAAFHAPTLAKVTQVAALDIADEEIDGTCSGA